MSALRSVGRTYCLLCGLLLGPLSLAFAVAFATDFFGSGALARVVQALQASPAGSEATNAPEPGADSQHQDRRASEQRLWARRLEQVGDGILRDVQAIEAQRAEQAQRAERLATLTGALVALLEQVLGEPVTEERLLASTEELRERLELAQADRARWPWLITTVQSMEPRAIAAILKEPGFEGMDGLRSEEAARLLGGLQPRKAGQVLAELGKSDPAQAARLLAQLGAAPATDASPDRKEGTP